MQGVILKGIAGFYYVESEGRVYACRARGIFRKDGITPLAGDKVIFSLEEGQVRQDFDGTIDEILPRLNSFDRPPVANVETMAIVMAARDPIPSFGLLDRFAGSAEKAGARLVICVSKTDLAEPALLERFRRIYTGIYPLFFVCGLSGEGIDELRMALRGSQTALAGPSGAGKSTIANLLLGAEKSATGEISAKSLRGKNTTRHSELFYSGGLFIFDTPGFTSFDEPDMEPEELQHMFPEFAPYLGKCRFSDCTHTVEPDCAVLAAAAQGMIDKSRMRSYREIYAALKEKREY